LHTPSFAINRCDETSEGATCETGELMQVKVLGN